MLEPCHVLHDRYQLQQRLGRTGAGRQTWLALDLQADPPESVVVKLLAFNPEMKWDELKLFEREAQVLKALDHPRIPRYRDYFSMDDQVLWFGLVQQYIPGLSLQDLLDRGDSFTESEIRQLAVNVLHILAYLHQHDPPRLHRDIKPSNLILGEDGYTYLVDFGAVQDRAALTGMTFTVVGTCGYAPLEQFWGRAVPASDLYALGATLIHLLTGISPPDLPQRNNRMQFAELVSLRPFFVHWLEKMTDPALEKRFENVQEALSALESGLLHQPVTASSGKVRKILQPYYSQIHLTASPTNLDVYIPPARGTRLFQRLLRWGCISFVGAGILSSLIVPLWFGVLPLGAVVTLTALLLFIYWVGLISNERTFLHFDGDRFRILRKSLGITLANQEGKTEDILGVFLTKADGFDRVTIRCESRVYYLSDAGTELECLWIAQEIQDWLNQQSY